MISSEIPLECFCQKFKDMRSTIKKKSMTQKHFRLFDKEQSEVDILSKYKPAQLSEEEVAVKVNEAIEQSGASSMQDMGKVMGQLKSLAGSADMGLISKLVKEKLS